MPAHTKLFLACALSWAIVSVAAVTFGLYLESERAAVLLERGTQ